MSTKRRARRWVRRCRRGCTYTNKRESTGCNSAAEANSTNPRSAPTSTHWSNGRQKRTRSWTRRVCRRRGSTRSKNAPPSNRRHQGGLFRALLDEVGNGLHNTGGSDADTRTVEIQSFVKTKKLCNLLEFVAAGRHCFWCVRLHDAFLSSSHPLLSCAGYGCPSGRSGLDSAGGGVSQASTDPER